MILSVFSVAKGRFFAYSVYFAVGNPSFVGRGFYWIPAFAGMTPPNPSKSAFIGVHLRFYGRDPWLGGVQGTPYGFRGVL